MESTDEVRLYRQEQRGVPLYWESYCLTTGEYVEATEDLEEPLETPGARYRRHYERIDWTR